MNTSRLKYKIYLKNVILIVVTLLLPGCLKVPSYQSKPLTVLSGRFNATSIKKHATVRVKVMNRHDSMGLFGKRGSWLMRTRRTAIIPLHISIENHSDQSLELDPGYISLETIPYELICKRMSSDGGLWALSTLLLGYPAGILLGLGGFCAIPVGNYIGSPALINAGWASLATGFCLTVATPFVAMGNAVRSIEANKELALDLHQKILKPNTIIKPYEHFETIVFVKKMHYKSQFTITLHAIDDPETKYVTHLKM